MLSGASKQARQLLNVYVPAGKSPRFYTDTDKTTNTWRSLKKDVSLLLRHHGKMVELQGAVTETALVSEMHWDPLGIEVLHMDLQRVDVNEKVHVTVPIRFHGEPVGTKEGGMFLENQHQVDIECPAGSIPDSVTLEIAELQLGSNLAASSLTLPEGVVLISPAEQVLCSVAAPKGQQGDEEEGAEASEPEVIAKGGGDAEGGDGE